MKLGTRLLLLSTLVFLVGCKKPFTDSDIKGDLIIDPTQNGSIEIYDPAARKVRRLEAGRKFVEMKQGLRALSLRLMDAGRSQIVKLEIPLSKMTLQENEFFVEGQKIQQKWNLKGERKAYTLQVEHVRTSRSRGCQIDGQPGLSGQMWEVRDVRHFYEVRFINPVDLKEAALFKAQGEMETTAQMIWTGNQCRLFKYSYAPIVGDL